MQSREIEGLITTRFSSEGEDAKSPVIKRRARRPRRGVTVDKFSPGLKDSARDNLRIEIR